MSLEKYVDKGFRKPSLAMIDRANEIVAEYQAQGFTLTLRQLFYQMVSRDIIGNNQKNYNNLGNLMSDARLAGLVDWEAIEDRTRNVKSNSHWDSPSKIIESCELQYQVDKWARQTYQPQVWIEKEALVGVIEGVCSELDVPFFACRGYNSLSEAWSSGKRLQQQIDHGQIPIIFHLGDHDPSGLDMTRDNSDRLSMFARNAVEVRRLALNRDQIDEYRALPNPAKVTDSRFGGYQELHGQDSWELDALEPAVIVALVRDAVLGVRDEDAWQESVKEEEFGKAQLHRCHELLRQRPKDYSDE
jgi:hypothetical protein